ncbi:MAG: hypothetical protein ABR863_04825 [Roseiarcus sp.]|jgi:hypothetical protein
MKWLGFFASRRVAPTATGAARRVAAKRRGDFALVGAGVAMAIGTIAFAGAVQFQDNRAPRINGMQYLAIFARPRGASSPVPAASPPAAAAVRVAAGAPDMAPTGSIAHGPADAHDAAPAASTAHAPANALDTAPTGSIGHGPAGGPSAAEPYRIVAVEPGMAWLSNGSEIRTVKPGEVVPSLGRIGSIERRGGRWALVADSGATLLASEEPEVKGPGGADGPFSRRMIFGDGK